MQTCQMGPWWIKLFGLAVNRTLDKECLLEEKSDTHPKKMVSSDSKIARYVAAQKPKAEVMKTNGETRVTAPSISPVKTSIRFPCDIQY